jgi:dephospho-CoA kinase
MAYLKRKNKKIKLIGLSGKMGTGKDTVCRIIQWLDNKTLQEQFRGPIEYVDFCEGRGGFLNMTSEDTTNAIYYNCKFATKIKEVVSILIGCKVKDLENQEFKSSKLPECWNIDGKSITVREFMQKVGTDALRDRVHPRIWINALYSNFKKNRKYIITDVRIREEAESVLERNGLLIRINKKKLNKNKYSKHITETDLDDYNKFDYVINNDGSIEDLVEELRKIF